MPDISVSEAHLERLEEIRDELDAVYVGEYGTVRPADALQYLLDTYTPPDADGGVDADADRDADTGVDADSSTPGGERDGDGDTPEDTLQQAMSLLDAHDDRWRESGGDEPYEVDLPDESTTGVRTKDDVKRLIFKHWR